MAAASSSLLPPSMVRCGSFRQCWCYSGGQNFDRWHRVTFSFPSPTFHISWIEHSDLLVRLNSGSVFSSNRNFSVRLLYKLGLAVIPTCSVQNSSSRRFKTRMPKAKSMRDRHQTSYCSFYLNTAAPGQNFFFPRTIQLDRGPWISESIGVLAVLVLVIVMYFT